MYRYFFAFFVVSLLLASGCQPDFDQLVRQEKNSGVRNDSIFMGYGFGMPRSAFFKHSFDLNHEGLITNGPENNSILYTFSDREHPIDMNFYPEFEQDKIYQMNMVFNYQSWAPWNKQFFATNLATEVLKILEKWFGTGFIELKTPDTGLPYWGKVNGNRQIIVRIQNERNVRVEISDLSVNPSPHTQPSPSGPRPLWEQHGN